MTYQWPALMHAMVKKGDSYCVKVTLNCYSVMTYRWPILHELCSSAFIWNNSSLVLYLLQLCASELKSYSVMTYWVTSTAACHSTVGSWTTLSPLTFLVHRFQETSQNRNPTISISTEEWSEAESGPAVRSPPKKPSLAATKVKSIMLLLMWMIW